MTSQTTDMPLSFLKPPVPATVGPDHTETDEFLLGRLREGDAKAGEILVLRYHEPLMRYLYRVSGQWALAEELHQQTWLSILEHLEKFDPSSSSGGFKAWLFRIATNKANDMWRSRSRQKNALDGFKQTQDDYTPSAGSRLEASEQECKLRESIARLPDAQRQVLLLRYYSGLKFTEIAELLGCPLNTALGRMHKAIIKLKEMMEKA
ncbi:MAG: RNA polymerase sigma factor [Phycisphaerae bacterium]|jgi:RNA polymerase sigma-70 factor (ECF subfamily)|nr:MAG: RNA polymerase sigma factor [Phycisphaerae bacterium]